jgi:hypothetical protein
MPNNQSLINICNAETGTKKTNIYTKITGNAQYQFPNTPQESQIQQILKKSQDRK